MSRIIKKTKENYFILNGATYKKKERWVIMQDYCGSNGCYMLESSEDFDGEFLEIYLNSPVVYVLDNNGSSVRVVGGDRPEPDIIFELFKNDEDGVLLTDKMEVPSLFLHGVKEFIIALLQYDREDFGTKEGLLKAVESLLDKEGAEWGIVHESAAE